MTYHCDRCGDRIIKKFSRCPKCNKMLYWEWKGGWIFGHHEPVNNNVSEEHAIVLRNEWKKKLDERYRQKGLFAYWGYKIFGEKDNIDRRRRRATTEEMAEVFRRHGHKCLKCGTQYDLTVDHKIPLARGGDWSIDNLEPLCRSCNSSKGIK